MTLMPEVAVSAVAVRDGEELLLVLRGRGPGEGCWSVPGGRVHFGEDLHEAVVREVLEETGLEVVVERFLGWAERIGDEPEPHHYVILDFLVDVYDPGREPVAGDDAAEARWVRFDDLYALPLVPGLTDFLADAGIIPPV